MSDDIAHTTGAVCVRQNRVCASSLAVQNYDETVLWKNVNLCKFNALRLRYDPGTKTTSFIAE